MEIRKLLKKQGTLAFFLMVLLIIVELAMQSFWYKKWGPYISPLIFFVSGLSAGILFLYFAVKNKWQWTPLNFSPRLSFPKILLFIIGIGISVWLLLPLINDYPVNFYKPQGSDIIPLVGIMVERYLDGSFPYTIISTTDWQAGYDLVPN